MKEQKKNSRKELNEIEISNLLDAEFKTLVIKMLKEHIGDINSIKKTQEEIKVTLTEIKEKLQKTNSEVNESENQINNLERKGKKIQAEQKEEKRIKK